MPVYAKNPQRRGYVLASLLLFVATMVRGQAPVDPGVRGGPAGSGGPLPGLTTNQSKYFSSGLDEFNQRESVSGTIPGTGSGLGPRFNLDSCGGCHTQPAAGGTSPATNPQIAVATLNGA